MKKILIAVSLTLLLMLPSIGHAQAASARNQVDNSYLELCFSNQTVSSSDQVETTLSNGLNEISSFGTFYIGSDYEQYGFTVEPCTGDTNLAYSFSATTTSLQTWWGGNYETTDQYSVNNFHTNINGFWMNYYGLTEGTTDQETITLQATDSLTGLVGPAQQISYTIYYYGNGSP
jgi:hypothetical protein